MSSESVEIPSRAEIAVLPRWAAVAFAARCATRVFPLFKRWAAKRPRAPKMGEETVRLAIDIAARVAGHAANVRTNSAAAAARTVAYAARADAAVHAAHAAHAAAHAAAAADADRPYAYAVPAAAIDAVTYAVGSSAGQVSGGIRSAIRRDFTTLSTWVHRNAADDHTPVSQDVFGPLWLPGEAPDWARDATTSDRGDQTEATAGDDPFQLPGEFGLVLKAIAEPGVSAEMVKNQLVRLYAALNEYTLACYGRHLTREQFRRLVYDHAGVPA